MTYKTVPCATESPNYVQHIWKHDNPTLHCLKGTMPADGALAVPQVPIRHVWAGHETWLGTGI